VLSVGGFVLSPGLVHDLAQIDLRQAERPPAQRILLLGPDPAGLAVRYAGQGSHVERGTLPGLSSLLSDAMLMRMNEEARSRLLAFVRDGATPCDAPLLRRPWSAAAIAGPGWEEEPIRFGAGLFGIRCRPPGATAPTPAVLFITMGTDVHSGYGRQTTTLARALAQGGVPSLRFDLGGVGDSDDRPDGALPLYRPDAVADVAAALDDLTGEGDRPVVAVGTCHGAYLAFHAACQDRRIAAALLVNLYCFDWDLTHGGVAYGATPVRHRAAYAAMLLKAATWRRILGGTTPVFTITGMLLRRGVTRLVAAVRPGSRSLRALPIAARIAALRRRGGRLVLLYSAGDLGLVDLRTQLGSLDDAAAILGEPVTVVPGADHSFAAEPAQDLLLRELRRVVGACGSQARVPAAANGARETRMASPRLRAT
jgi:pimeloyl-ACP methyl ester carboxylesterase